MANRYKTVRGEAEGQLVIEKSKFIAAIRPVENQEEAEAFLEDCMAVVADSLDKVREYFEEEGIDVDGMTTDELAEASEVFPLPDGTYLIVEG